MLLHIDNNEFKKLFAELQKEENDMGNNMFNAFRRCIGECFGQCCLCWEDITPYDLSEEEIEKIFFEALYDFGRKEFYEYWLIQKGEAN